MPSAPRLALVRAASGEDEAAAPVGRAHLHRGGVVARALAFGIPAARRIELTGISAGNLLDGLPHAATLLSLACQGPTGDGATDYAADFTGPTAVSTAGMITLSR